MAQRFSFRGSRIAGVVLVLIGLLLILTKEDFIPWGKVWGTWWPLVLIAIGVWRLLKGQPPPLVSGSILIAIGALAQLAELEVLPWLYVFALLLAGIGVWMLVRPAGAAETGVRETREEEAFDRWSIFGAMEVAATSKAFRGGQACAVFGSVTLDLSGAVLAEGEAPLTLSAVFGSVELKVPEGWRVSLQGTPILGSLTDRRRTKEAHAADAPLLRVSAFTLLGSVEIQSA